MRAILFGLVLFTLASVASAQTFELRDGDRVVLVGSTLIEREQRDGYWELMLTSRFPGRQITFRNLGWSGDTVWGEARAGFDPPAKGLERLVQHVKDLQPTVILIGYGTNESFAGPTGVSKFSAGVQSLLKEWAPLKARIVFLAPLKQEEMPPPLPNPAEANRRLWDYASELHEIATNHDHGWLDIEPWIRRHRDSDEQLRLTDNGIHLTPLGYWITAAMIENELQFAPSGWKLALSADGKVVDRAGTKAEQVTRGEGTWQFRLTSDVLPVTAPMRHPGRSGMLTVKDLPAGKYQLTIDGDPILTAAQDDWAGGVALDDHHELRQIEQLRRSIVQKNELYFHRWRPQNITYLLGFRKHEQGQNAAELPQFDTLIKTREQDIAKLRVPQSHLYELKRVP